MPYVEKQKPLFHNNYYSWSYTKNLNCKKNFEYIIYKKKKNYLYIWILIKYNY